MHGIGAALILLGGVMEGLFTLPVKLTPKWAWENIWGLGSLAALVLVPLPLLLLTMPQYRAVYAAAPTWAIASTILFGAGWGLGGIFFGLGVAELGLSLGTSSIMGLIAISGSVVPLLLQHHGHMPGSGGTALLAGIAVMLLGLIVCSRAGSLKMPSQGVTASGAAGPSFLRGALYCVAAGLLSALVNFALIFGAPITRAATDAGAPLSCAQAGDARQVQGSGDGALLALRNRHGPAVGGRHRYLWTGRIDGRHLWAGLRFPDDADRLHPYG